MFRPVHFFSKMPREGGLAGPLLYGFILGEIGFLFSLMWEGMSVFVPPFVDQNGFGDFVGEAAGITFFIFASPAIVLAVLFIFSAILHVCLFIVGGAQKSFETTFRVVCYASSTDLLEIIPCCGWCVGLIWNLVLTIIGIRETHEISTERAALAVLLPAIFCCGCIALILLIALPHVID
ncbi:MAG: YIP1 family protein [Gemmatimonadota bacterium]|nr:MAG: YIP1 family protein [Gemmatimonadota bacterium]